MRVATVRREHLGTRGLRIDPPFHVSREGRHRLVEDAVSPHVPLGDLLAELRDGTRLPSATSGLPLVRLSNLRAAEITFVGLGYVDPGKSDSWPQVQVGDVLFTRAATPFRAAAVPAGAPSPLTVAPEVSVLRPRAAVLPEYLAAVLSTAAYQRTLEDLAYRRQSAPRRLRLEDIRRLPFPVPRRTVQEEIKAAYDRAAHLAQQAQTEVEGVVRIVHAEIDARLSAPDISARRFQVRRAHLELESRWDVPFARGRLLRGALRSSDVVVPLLSLAKPVPASLRGIDEEDLVLAVQADDVNEATFLVEGFERRRLSELSPRMRQPLAAGDVLLCTTGSGQQIAYLDEQLDEGALPILGSATFTALRFAETPRFYAVTLAHPVVRSQLDLLASGTVQRFVKKRDLDELLVPHLGGIWRQDFELRLDRAMERRREALEARGSLLARADAFVEECWQGLLGEGE